MFFAYSMIVQMILCQIMGILHGGYSLTFTVVFGASATIFTYLLLLIPPKKDKKPAIIIPQPQWAYTYSGCKEYFPDDISYLIMQYLYDGDPYIYTDNIWKNTDL